MNERMFSIQLQDGEGVNHRSLLDVLIKIRKSNNSNIRTRTSVTTVEKQVTLFVIIRKRSRRIVNRHEIELTRSIYTDAHQVTHFHENVIHYDLYLSIVTSRKKKYRLRRKKIRSK